MGSIAPEFFFSSTHNLLFSLFISTIILSITIDIAVLSISDSSEPQLALLDLAYR
jgi:hypothetical protein